MHSAQEESLANLKHLIIVMLKLMKFLLKISQVMKAHLHIATIIFQNCNHSMLDIHL